MALALDSAQFKENGTDDLATVTWSHTIGSVNNRILFIFVPVSQAVTVSSVTYGGTALTLAIGKTGTDNTKAYIYYMVAPPIGAANCVITFNTNLTYLVGGSASFSGVNQGTPYLNTTSANATAQNKSNTVVCTYGTSYIIECLGAGSGTHSAQSGQTWVGNANRFGSYDTGVAVGNNTQTWNSDGSAPYAWVGLELAAASTTNFFMFM